MRTGKQRRSLCLCEAVPGQKQKLVSIKKLNDFGWQNRTGLEKAINETIRFFSKGNKDVI